MISIGINKNVYITSASIITSTDKSYLEIGFDQTGTNKPATAFDMLNSDTIIDTPPTFNMFLFATNVPKNEDGKLTQEKMVDRVTKDIKANKEILLHLMMGYMTVEAAKVDLYQGLSITSDNYNTQILREEVLKIIFANMAKNFVEKMKPFIAADPKLTFRLLLTRQSKDKHFASFRKNYINENPFWESMDVPDAQSKLKFTDYEIREGLTDATPVPRTTADPKTGATAAAPSQVHTAASVFGQ